MRIICNHFGDETFARLAGALKMSIFTNAPSSDYHEIVTDRPPVQPGLLRHYTDNHAKLKVWRAAVHTETNGTELVLIDADTLVLGELDSAFAELDENDLPFDVGWTWRPGRLPVNSGVVYIRCNERSRAFMDAWVERDALLMSSRTLANHGARKYGGANQASFMWLIAQGHGQDIAGLHALMCRKWNSVDQTWCDFGPDTRVLHIKGRLRDACMGKPLDPFFADLKTLRSLGKNLKHTIGALAELWREYDPARVEVRA